MADVVKESRYDERIFGTVLLSKQGALQRVLFLGDGLAEIGSLAALVQQHRHSVEDGGHGALIVWSRSDVGATSA